MSSAQIAVVIPHYQKQPGLLAAALRSAFSQTIARQIHVVVVDDESPISASSEVELLTDIPPEVLSKQLTVIRQKNGGAGAARNTALNHVPSDTAYVAYLDSDDAWRPHHLEHAMVAFSLGYDAYFCNFIGVGYPDQGHFERVGTMHPKDHPLRDAKHSIHELACSALEHTVSDGGGLIGTPTVVYNFAKYRNLRFREEFYNGQDFFFWMDLSQLGARFAFSFDIGCDNGTGVNIYQASGWGSEKSLQRLRNELFVWTSVNRFYPLNPQLKIANKSTIRNLQQGVVRDLLHRLRHRRPISGKLLGDIIKMDPMILPLMPWVPIKVIINKLLRRGS
jgi:succinoglycan biosynthesis protein ExoW